MGHIACWWILLALSFILKEHNFMTPQREQEIAEAIKLVGERGTVQDYQCDCEPGGERFLVLWNGETLRTCYNLEEIRKLLK